MRRRACPSIHEAAALHATSVARAGELKQKQPGTGFQTSMPFRRGGGGGGRFAAMFLRIWRFSRLLMGSGSQIVGIREGYLERMCMQPSLVKQFPSL